MILELLKQVNIKPNNLKLYEEAFTHSSFGHENSSVNNERLEFLGDAVIELLMSDYLYLKEVRSEGEMTKDRAKAVRKEALLRYANSLDINKYIRLGSGEKAKGAVDAIIADALEAFLGAIYLDLGFAKVKEVFEEFIVPLIQENLNNNNDYKTCLQEFMQVDKRIIEYRITKESGPQNNKEFEAKVFVDGYCFGVGVGSSKKSAEQFAAKEALKKRVS